MIRTPSQSPGRLASAVALLFLCAALAGCGKRVHLHAAAPHETLLAIVNESLLFQATDIYRNPYPRDLTGQSVGRATLVRLANYEDLHPGRFTPEIEMLRGRILADLGDHAGARDRFLRCAEFETPLRPQALEQGEAAAAFVAILAQELDMQDLETHLAERHRQIEELKGLEARLRGTRWEVLALVERESLEIARAEMIHANQFAIPGGVERARGAFERLAGDHAESRRALAHALRLARFHLDQARLLERLQDAERGAFDWNRFTAHMEIALDLFHRVGQADGRPEMIQARHQLDEALAYHELVRQRSR